MRVEVQVNLYESDYERCLRSLLRRRQWASTTSVGEENDRRRIALVWQKDEELVTPKLSWNHLHYLILLTICLLP